jgi:hypothetical protein
MGLLYLLVVCIRSYLNSLSRYIVLILNTYNPVTLYVLVQGCEDTRLLFKGQRGPRANSLGNTAGGFSSVSTDKILKD